MIEAKRGKAETAGKSSLKSSYIDPETLSKVLQCRSNNFQTANAETQRLKRDFQAAHRHDDLDDEWKVMPTMIESMKDSSWLRNELNDPGLRYIIEQIATASNLTRRNQSLTLQEEFLEQVKEKYPRFKVFLDKLLVLTGVLERTEDGSSDLQQWLAQDNVDVERGLQLKSISRPTRGDPCIPIHLETESRSESEQSSSSSKDDDDSSDDSSDAASDSEDSDDTSQE